MAEREDIRHEIRSGTLGFESEFTNWRMALKAKLLPLGIAALVALLPAFVATWFSFSLSAPDGAGLGYALTGSSGGTRWPVAWSPSPSELDAVRAAGGQVFADSSYIYIEPAAGQAPPRELAEKWSATRWAFNSGLLAGGAVWVVLLSGFAAIGYGRLQRRFQKTGELLQRDTHVRGARVLAPLRSMREHDHDPSFQDEMEKIGAGQLPLFTLQSQTVFLPLDLELTHLLFLGATGSGKTQTLAPMLKAALARGTKSVIFDVKGDFTAQLYTGQSAVLFGPMDVRSVPWNPFDDITDLWGAREFAAVLIPDNPQGGGDNDYFVKGPRDLLGAILIALMEKRETKNGELLAAIKGRIEKLHELLADVPAAAPALTHIIEKGKQTQGVLSSLRTFCQPLDLLERWSDLGPRQGGFSFSEYIKDDQERRTLIMQSVPEREQVCAPLLSAAYNIMFKATLARPESYDPAHRNIFWFDELAQLQKMESFLQLMTLARSKNSAVFAALQDWGIIRSKYGKDKLESITNGFNSIVAGRLLEPEALQWLEKRFGQQEILKTEEGHSFGPSDFADRMTANRRRDVRTAVLGSEIATLPPLTAFYMVNNALTKVTREYQRNAEIAKPYIPYSDLAAIKRARVDFGEE